MSNQPDWLVEMTSRSWLAVKARLPTKPMLSTLVTSPSLTTKVTSTCPSRLIDDAWLDLGGEPAQATVVLAQAQGVGVRPWRPCSAHGA